MWRGGVEVWRGRDRGMDGAGIWDRGVEGRGRDRGVDERGRNRGVEGREEG